MSNLTILDLAHDTTLDHQAMAAVRGSFGDRWVRYIPIVGVAYEAVKVAVYTFEVDREAALLSRKIATYKASARRSYRRGR